MSDPNTQALLSAALNSPSSGASAATTPSASLFSFDPAALGLSVPPANQTLLGASSMPPTMGLAGAAQPLPFAALSVANMGASPDLSTSLGLSGSSPAFPNWNTPTSLNTSTPALGTPTTGLGASPSFSGSPTAQVMPRSPNSLLAVATEAAAQRPFEAKPPAGPVLASLSSNEEGDEDDEEPVGATRIKRTADGVLKRSTNSGAEVSSASALAAMSPKVSRATSGDEGDEDDDDEEDEESDTPGAADALTAFANHASILPMPSIDNHGALVPMNGNYAMVPAGQGIITDPNIVGEDGGQAQFIDITHYLNMPQSQAAKKLGIPTSTLSKRWKEAVRNRKWPYRAISKLDKEIMTLLHNIPQNGDNAPLPSDIEATLGHLLRRRQEELKPVRIRIN